MIRRVLALGIPSGIENSMFQLGKLAIQSSVSTLGTVAIAAPVSYTHLDVYKRQDGFMIQGGDPNGDGTGGSKENIKGEFSNNGVDNDISHTSCLLYTSYPDKMSNQNNDDYLKEYRKLSGDCSFVCQ